jgi:uncharacterized protein (DUF305 family)
MAALSFVSMYILMYMMVNSYANVYTNLNQFYMAGMMTAPMLIIELLLMESMYPNKELNKILILASLIVGVFFIIGIRKQTAIQDKEFLRSMIPHHAAALLMCEQASLQDPDIQELCKSISLGQQAEIDFMKAKLAALD